jgi:hypothetical protein
MNQATRRTAAALVVVGVGVTAIACDGGTGDGDGKADTSSSGGTAGVCKDTADKFALSHKAVLRVLVANKVQTSGATVEAEGGSLVAGQALDVPVVISNGEPAASARELKIVSVGLDYQGPAGLGETKKPFSCWAKVPATGKRKESEAQCQDFEWPMIDPPDFNTACGTPNVARAQGQTLAIRFTKPADATPREVTLKIVVVGEQPKNAETTFLLKIRSSKGSPKLTVLPATLDMGTVKVGGTQSEPFAIKNQGNADLVVSHLTFAKSDPKPWSMTLQGKTYKGGADVDVVPPVVIPKDQTVKGEVSFTAVDPSPHLTQLLFKSQDGQTATVQVQANQNAACLKFIPKDLISFGFQSIGKTAKKPLTLKNCGSAEVEIADLAVADDAFKTFSADMGAIASLGGKPVSSDNPIRIAVNGQQDVLVSCTPDSENKDKDGKQTPFTAQVKVKDNTVQPDKAIKLECWGSAKDCPTAMITVIEGEQVAPQTTIHLKASQSFASTGKQIAKYKWKLLKYPAGTEGLAFYPNDSAAEVTFGAMTTVPGKKEQVPQVNTAGEYELQLEVFDDTGLASCMPAKVQVLVVPTAGLHIELLWDTPSDPVKSDTGEGKGTDLDLHFAHPNAVNAAVCQKPPKMCGVNACACQPDGDKDGTPDPWFHPQYDVFWFNKAPTWVPGDPDANPSLDLDDTDGWGPENLNLVSPENGSKYWVGVHYWDAHKFGDSKATVNFFVLGALVATVTRQLKECDMWWVRKVDWPSGDIVFVPGDEQGGQGKVTPLYKSDKLTALGPCGQK